MSKIEKIAVNGHYVWVDKNAEIVAWYLQANTDIICKASEPNTPKEWGNQIIAASPELNLEGVPSYVEVGWEDKTMSNEILEYVKFIEQETGIPYKGKKIKDAEIYIRKNKNKVPASGSINMWSIVNY